MSTNKPGIDLVVLEIALELLKILLNLIFHPEIEVRT